MHKSATKELILCVVLAFAYLDYINKKSEVR
jgi:hypothetical protein